MTARISRSSVLAMDFASLEPAQINPMVPKILATRFRRVISRFVTTSCSPYVHRPLLPESVCTYHSAHGFQKLAAVSAMGPRLFGWGARALYLGHALNLSAHRNAVAVLAIGVDAPFSVSADPTDAAADYMPCRTAMIPPNTLHHFMRTDGLMAFLYMDPRSPDMELVYKKCRMRTPRAALHFGREDELITRLRLLGAGDVTWAQAREGLREVLGLPGQREIDTRIKRSLDLLHAEPGARPSLTVLAGIAGLSTSRFTHLFKDVTGVPVRRYKLWLAMGAAMRSLAQGENLTVAALSGGFSSSAHFSAAFREMFGLEPSRLVRITAVQ
jgi:AraC-like DNA-binding protein